VHLTIIKQHDTSIWHKTNSGNTELVLLLMFGFASFGFVLLLIDDWQLAIQVNIRQSFLPILCSSLFAKFFCHHCFYHTVFKSLIPTFGPLQ